MAQLACRFTFLDVLLESEERVMAARGAALRARSAPPSRGWSSLVGPEVAEDQAEMQSYEKAADSLLEADALLDILGEEMSATDEAVNSRAKGMGRGSLQQLMKRLRRINFANLVAMAAQRCEDSRARLLGALQDLRAQE